MLVEVARTPPLSAALLSIHTSGYVREVALRELAVVRSQSAFPFVVLRCADWVSEVREAAYEAFREGIDAIPTSDLIGLLPLLDHLGAKGQRRTPLLPQVVDAVFLRLEDDDLVRALGREDLRARHACARLLVQRGSARRALAAALTQGDPLTAQIIGRAVLSEQSSDDPEAILELLFRSRFASLAGEASWYLIQRSPDRQAFATSHLLDPRRPVRANAQDEANRWGVNLSTFYRERLATEPIALKGLAECGTGEDLGSMVAFLTDPQPRRRATVVGAVGRLDPDRYLNELLTALHDPSPAVAIAAARGLTGRGDSATANAIVGCFTSEDTTPTCRRAARYVAMRMRRWQQLYVGLVCVGVVDRDVAAVGLELVERAVTDSKSFTPPTKEQSAAIAARAREVGDRVPPPLRERLDFLLAAEGIER